SPGRKKLPLPGNLDRRYGLGRAGVPGPPQIAPDRKAVAKTEGDIMEHGRFDYSPIARRPVMRLPGGARIAVWITPNIEHFHYDKPAMSMAPMTAGLRPDVLNYAWRDYGPRVGIWRMMEILERQGFVATTAVNSEACLHYPEIIEEGNCFGWECMAHGQRNSLLLTGPPEAEERGIIDAVLRTIAQHTGECCRGWLGPALTETDNTLDLLAEAGVEY